MKKLFSLLTLVLGTLSVWASPVWFTDMEVAKTAALKSGKPILVDFTGSDWCPPCKALHKNVFESPEFAQASAAYVLLELDFPQKIAQDPTVKAKNAELSKKYAVTGFPTVLLLDAKTGDVFGKTVGFGGESAAGWLAKVGSFKNTPEVRQALAAAEGKASAKMEKSRVLGDKLKAAIAAKDFKAAEAALEEIFADAPADRKAILPLNKGRILLQIDPTAQVQALKYVDQAIEQAAGNAQLMDSFKKFRATMAAPAASGVKLDAESKKGS